MAGASTLALADGQKYALFFLAILSSMKSKPEVEWDLVAQKAGYSNGKSARVRFHQIKKELGVADDGAAPAAGVAKTPPKPRAKKEKVFGSGTIVDPSKVTKNRTPKKNAKAGKIEDEMVKIEKTKE